MRELQIGGVLKLTTQNNQVCFLLKKHIGSGGGCVAYEVTYEEADEIIHTGILKEYCPAYLEEYGDVRNEDGSLIIPPEISTQFFAELEKFKGVYVSINEYLLNHPEAANFHPVLLGIFEGNNTLYTLASCDYGESYEKIEDNDLKSVLSLMLAITKGVEQYHNAGFLHLDIKPENIFVLDEVTELVKLFDYDSLTAIEDIEKRKIKAFPCPGVYYVPELNQRNIRAIGKSTDIFEIGAMLFLRLFGKAPESKDTSFDSVYDFSASHLLKGVSPKVLYELEDLFKHTIQTAVSRRYKNAGELRRQLQKLLLIVDSKQPYLMNMPKWQPSAGYLGREREIQEIHRRLQTDGYVFVKGIGGLGKSELAKIYAEQYEDMYHTVVFGKYVDGLDGFIANLPFQGINVDDYTDFEKLVKDKNQALHDCDSHTLIIVDNFNVTYDKYLRDFLPASADGFKVIFTTRCTQAAEYYENKTFELPKLSDENCQKLFCARSGVSASDSNLEKVENLIKIIDSNTLVLVLLAAAVKRTHMSLDDVISKIEEQELESISPKLFHEYDYETEDTQAYSQLLSHLYAVFSISALNSDEIETLKAMTLIDSTGILISELIEFCNSTGVIDSTIRSLANQSWLFIDDDEAVSMHPTVSDLIANKAEIPKRKSYSNLAEALEDYCNPDYVNHFSVVLNRLSAAVQLDRRYKTEDLMKRIPMKAKVGRLYANVYRPIEARKYLTESERLTVGTRYEFFLPYLYSFFGELEKDFGTITKAIDYYEKSVCYAKKPLIRYYEIAAESMIAIGECYVDNRQYDKAYEQLRDALKFSRLHGYSDKIADAAHSLISVCRELNLPEKEKKYQQLFEKYKPGTEYDTAAYQETADLYSGKENISDFVRKYTAFLEKKKHEYGEDSPMYKDIAQGKWTTFVIAGDKETAIRAANEDLSFAEQTYGKVSMEIADRLCLIASLFPALDEFEYAENAAKRAMSICEKLHEKTSYTYFSAKLSLAELYIALGQSGKAREIVETLDVNAFQGSEMLSDFISSAGLTFCELSMAEKIEPHCIEFLRRSGTDIKGKLWSLVILCMVNEQRGNLDEADQYSKQAIKLIEQINDDYIKKQFSPVIYRASARILWRRGSLDEAINVLQHLMNLYSPEEKCSDLSFSGVYTELGLYFSAIGNKEDGMKAFKEAETILTAHSLPKDAYVTLYNNIAFALMQTYDFASSKVYLDKIINIKPDVINPKTFLDAIICGNIAWTEFGLSNAEYAIKLAEKSLKCFEKINATDTKDYLTVAVNLVMMYDSQGMVSQTFNLSKELLATMRRKPDLFDATIHVLAAVRYVYSSILSNKAKEAYKYAKTLIDYYADVFGNDTLKYADVLLDLGLAFASARYEDCTEFYKYAQDLMENNEQTATMPYAKLMNLVGAYFGNFHEKWDQALGFFGQAKDILESLGKKEDSLYKQVLENIEYANTEKQKEFDKLIANLANAIKKNGDDSE